MKTKEIRIITEKDMQHGIDYIPGHDVKGWYAPEKYDGCRTYWDGFNLWSRGGINIDIPDRWREQLPASVEIDFELYDGPDGLYRCGAAIRYGNFTNSMELIVLDMPSVKSDYWSERMDVADAYLIDCAIARTTERPIVSGIDEAAELLAKVQARGGEGLMLRDDHCPYKPDRTNKLMKLTFID